MKLWHRISVLCICILGVVLILCGALLLFQAQENILNFNISQVRAEQKTLVSSFTEMTQYYIRDEINPVAQQSGVKYCFTSLADESSVLISSGETLYSSIGITPETLLPIDSVYLDNTENEQFLFLNPVEGRHTLIVGSGVALYNNAYLIYVVKDITDVYDSLDVIKWRFILICSIGIIIGALLIVWLVRRTSKPLMMLKDVTQHIAGGAYNERAQVCSKDEVGELAENFNTMADVILSHITDLQNTADRQQIFIGGLTHEFKTPMTSMILHTDTLLSAKLSQEDMEKSLTHIYAQCRWLERLTQKLLKLITLQHEIQTHPENVPELIEDVRESAAETLRERQTPLVTQCDATFLDMDYDLVKSMLINLIDNASKASAPGQTLRLQVHDNTIEVQDSGHGIPEDEVTLVTDPFYMADRSRSKQKGGSGLGLALVKCIADAHNARMIIESKVNVGTTVKVIFPVKMTPPE
ncbi:MAG: HAMP domain-containing histidine kinase [Peptococcaceae bacterium]|nr:HAMP domain-containing histidine kinase [Peptococcaceae bacterium]